MKITVLGAGAWGTALAVGLAARHTVTLWSWQLSHVESMAAASENLDFLPGIALPPSLNLSADLETSSASAELILVATPLSGLRNTVKQLAGLVSPARPIVWVCKGLEAGTSLLPHQVVAEELGADAPACVLTGPSFAIEVARGLPAAVTLASNDIELARQVARELHSPRLRIYAGDDLVGAEVGGAVKNVMAIAAGMSDGMGFGLNARAALLTRGLAEITRLGVNLGARRETLMGLAGMGDLVLTCTGDLSRNRQVGLALAQGKSLDVVLKELGHTAEGVMTSREVDALARARGVDMPITRAVTAILHEGVSPKDAVQSLLERDPKPESL